MTKVRANTNWYIYTLNNPANYIDLWGLWELHGDGTATAQPGDTLWGLADMVTKDGTKWVESNYNGVPEQLQIGQRVNYVGMTTVVPTNAHIVEGTVHTPTSVQEDFARATINLNSQGVPITYDVTISIIGQKSTGGINLSDLQVGDNNFNLNLMDTVGIGIVVERGILPILMIGTGI